jgi:hypothetical protein
MKKVTVLIQGEKYVTLSSVYPQVCRMLQLLYEASENINFAGPVRKFASTMQRQLQDRLNSQFIKPASLIATFVDPRFKSLRAIPVLSRIEAKHFVQAAMFDEQILLATERDRDQINEDDGASVRNPSRLQFQNAVYPDPGQFEFHDFGRAAEDVVVNQRLGESPVGQQQIENELRMYETEVGQYVPGSDCIPDMSKDPCLWWKVKAVQYPLLSRVARKYLGIPATSAAAERMFSYTGLRVGKRNCSLGDDTLLSTLYVRAMVRFVAKYGTKYLSSSVDS